MARTKKTDAPGTAKAIELTAGAIERLICRTDSKAPGLRVRITNTGAKSFVFEAKLNRQTIRRTIGDVKVWSIVKNLPPATRRTDKLLKEQVTGWWAAVEYSLAAHSACCLAVSRPWARCVPHWL